MKIGKKIGDSRTDRLTKKGGTQKIARLTLGALFECVCMVELEEREPDDTELERTLLSRILSLNITGCSLNIVFFPDF